MIRLIKNTLKASIFYYLAYLACHGSGWACSKKKKGMFLFLNLNSKPKSLLKSKWQIIVP